MRRLIRYAGAAVFGACGVVGAEGVRILADAGAPMLWAFAVVVGACVALFAVLMLNAEVL